VQAHELLVGPTTLPIATITDTYVSERAPDEVARIADMASALEHLELAFGQFSKSAEDMRELQAEVRGDEGVRAGHEAEAALGAALASAASDSHNQLLDLLRLITTCSGRMLSISIDIGGGDCQCLMASMSATCPARVRTDTASSFL
jgi:hypothetical protein